MKKTTKQNRAVKSAQPSGINVGGKRKLAYISGSRYTLGAPTSERTGLDLNVTLIGATPNAKLAVVRDDNGKTANVKFANIGVPVGADGVLGTVKNWARVSSSGSVMDAQCPSRLVLDRIADKWTALIIQVLANGTKRYAGLQREIGGISQKMLTQTLRSLERDGLVQRKVHPVVPPKVEYSLTKLGRTLIEPLHALCRWSEKHLAELQANRIRAKANATE